MRKNPLTRRQVMSRLAVLFGGLVSSRNALAVTVTPKATEGPFYPTESMRPADIDNDLVKVAGLVREAGGEVLNLKGRISDRGGQPRAGLRIEIWQCDMNGKYLHTGDNRNVAYDKGFQGFGHDITRDDGAYSFRTIKPVTYPGRTPHIHVKVCEGDKELLTTQFYIKGHPDNQRDSLFRRMSTEQADAVSMDLVMAGVELETSVDIVL